MLFALLIGMALHPLSRRPAAAPGLALASRQGLRVGVALLGLRLAFEDIASLGVAPVLTVALLVALTVGSGTLIAVRLGRSAGFGLLASGSVAICGASAALAIASVLPEREAGERDVLFVVAGVTGLSTLAMVLYPLLFGALGLAEVQSGFLIGATIHDVAQVVGAGYSVGPEAGDVATYVKLQRVALLPVVLILGGWALRRRGGASAGGPLAGLPWFVVAFAALVVAGNLLALPGWLTGAADAASRALLLTAIAGLGVKTSVVEMARLGPRHAAAVVLPTLVLLGLGLTAVLALGVV